MQSLLLFRINILILCPYAGIRRDIHTNSHNANKNEGDGIMYSILKHSHMLFALISGMLFLLRGIWMLLDSNQLQKRWVKVLPHVNDTLLLGCAIGLMVILGQYPFVDHWLTAKVVALVLYIGIGVIAIKRGKTKPIRAMAFVTALLIYVYIIGVAIKHSAWSFIA